MPALSTLTTTLIAGMSLGIWVYLLFAGGGSGGCRRRPRFRRGTVQ